MITIKAQEKAKKEEYQKGKNLLKQKGTMDKTKCKHCGNFHKGESHLKDTTNDFLKGGRGNPPKNRNGTGNPKKNKKPKLAEQLQRLTESVQSLQSNKSHLLWGKDMEANKYNAITLSLAMDNSCAQEQVLTLPINNEMLTCHRAAYKTIC